VGSRFVATPESSAHQAFKDAVIAAKEGDTHLSMKKLVPVRLLRNRFFAEIKEMEDRGASNEELAAHLGRARAKRGMFEGDMDEGELEIGQVAASIAAMTPAAEVVRQMVTEYNAALEGLRPM
jgi:enoyl-[acyl-carrier protein] reductase II